MALFARSQAGPAASLSRLRRIAGSIAAGGIAWLAMASGAAAQGAAEAAVHKTSAPMRAVRVNWPAQVHAVYAVTFNGLDIGSFDFASTVSGQTYTLTGNAQLSALLGAFQWKGTTRSFGMLAGNAPRPSAYLFDFAGTGKSGSLKLGFADNRVVNVAAVPPPRFEPGVVPVLAPHLSGVVDPLSAIMAMARAEGSPCDRRVPIFDGKQRFDLVLSYRRQEAIAEARPSGQPSVAIVCGVRYVPLAGHKANDETRQMAASHGIEIAFRPVPMAGLMVPYRIVIPTAAGTAALVSQHVTITMPSRQQIAFVH